VATVLPTRRGGEYGGVTDKGQYGGFVGGAGGDEEGMGLSSGCLVGRRGSGGLLGDEGRGVGGGS